MNDAPQLNRPSSTPLSITVTDRFGATWTVTEPEAMPMLKEIDRLSKAALLVMLQEAVREIGPQTTARAPWIMHMANPTDSPRLHGGNS